MVDTHREWRVPAHSPRSDAEHRASPLHQDLAFAVVCTSATECNPMVGIRARMRANRTYTQVPPATIIRQSAGPLVHIPCLQAAGALASISTPSSTSCCAVLAMTYGTAAAAGRCRTACHAHPPALTVAFHLRRGVRAHQAQTQHSTSWLSLCCSSQLAFLTQVSIRPPRQTPLSALWSSLTKRKELQTKSRTRLEHSSTIPPHRFARIHRAHSQRRHRQQTSIESYLCCR